MHLKIKFGLFALTAAAAITAQSIVAQTLDKFVYMPAISVPASSTPTLQATLTATATMEPTATATTEATPLPTATATLPPPPTVPPPPVGGNVVCATNVGAEVCAWVSETNPARGSDVTVYGRLIISGAPQVGQSMQSTWRYKSSTPTCNFGVTGSDGIANCTRDIGSATSGFQVNIEVSIAGNTVETFFTPQ